MSKNYVSIGQASEELGVHPNTIRGWVKKGKVNSILTPGGTRSYDIESIKKEYGLDGKFNLTSMSKKKQKQIAKQKEKLMNEKKTHYLLQFFDYEHLPEHLQVVSKSFGELAQHLVDTLPSNPESTTALRKLLEAKDCAVRSLLYKE